MLETCGEMYRLYYEERIRSKILGSALMFGSAMDVAFNELLMAKHILTPVSVDKAVENARAAFDKAMTDVTINGKVIDPIEYEHMQYSKADLDISLLELDTETSAWLADYQEKASLKGYVPSPENRLVYNKLCYESLYKKGLILLDYYQEVIMPQIEVVYEVQKQVQLPNDNGDNLNGVIDVILKFVGDENIYITDNKTASTAYKESDLYESKQLSTYAEYMQNNNVAYIVIEKNLRKKEPRIRHQIIKGKITEDLVLKTFNDYEQSLNKIRNKEFDKNESKCYNHYGRQCAYINMCKYGRLDKTLEKLEEKK